MVLLCFSDWCHCGTILNNQVVPAIVGGQEAEVNSIPWQVLIVHVVYPNFYPICGGTIIGPSTILTAAHCLEDNGTLHNIEDIIVMVSEHDWSTFDEADHQ
jgi:secreted trypsin-like serine protease